MLIVLVSAVNVAYLTINCPIDLSGDEAQYWDWSRRLDYSYYSKGPAVAFVIRAGAAVFGETMPGVRLPAILLFAATLAGIYSLTLVLFRSDRLALGATGLACLSPIMIYLSAAMTIDAPMIACWTFATLFAAAALFRDRSWAWGGVSAAIGVGFLAKYSALLWFVGLLAYFVCMRAPIRLWARGAAAAVGALVFTTPVIVWNINHGWVGARHVAKQTGAEEGRFSLLRPVEMLGTQVGVVGPTIAAVIIAAVVWVIRRRRVSSQSPPDKLAELFLLCIGAPFFILTWVVSFFAKVQANWPAPAYITLIILAAAFVGELRRGANWKRWRGWVYATIIIGIGAHVVMRDTSFLIPPARALGLSDKHASRLDALAELRGWEELGRRVGEEQVRLGPDALILCDHYQQTALMAFYVPHRPRTFHAGTYFTNAQRMNQYSLWPDMDLSRPELRGRNAIYVGKGGPLPDPLPLAFERYEKLPEVPVQVHGVTVATFKLWRLYGFKGLHRPEEGGGF
ncbi:MAG TPA: glycosyltransferase family 39 protein [Tepidisphaeraceae bacterium]|nr:glycosyltransferase family 39 protein [Tepidisphaeraceae bacterium]